LPGRDRDRGTGLELADSAKGAAKSELTTVKDAVAELAGQRRVASVSYA
jgi:hypothetical protein